MPARWWARRAAANGSLERVIRAAPGRLVVDLLDGGRALEPLLVARGFRVQRRFHRMALGRASLPGDPGARAGGGRAGIRLISRRNEVRLHRSELPAPVLETLRQGVVIPAHPLALDPEGRFDARRQRALGRYYLDAGAGGLAVGVHATQFGIREAGLLEPVLACAAETTRAWTDRPIVLIAGLCGPTAQALAEARIALALGYHAACSASAPCATPAPTR